MKWVNVVAKSNCNVIKRDSCVLVFGLCSLGDELIWGIKDRHVFKLWKLYSPVISSEGHFGGQVNQSVRYVHSSVELAILIKMNTNNPTPKSMVLKSCARLAAKA